MTTAFALANLTDRSLFELLATNVLRAAVPKYAGIVHTGLNSKGEAVPSPVDGIHRVLGSSPPEWVVVQHTTTDRAGLSSKWLDSKDGDIAKAAMEASHVRASEPNALVTLVLTCNQSPSDKLVIRAQEGRILRIADVAKVIDSQSDVESLARALTANTSTPTIFPFTS